MENKKSLKDEIRSRIIDEIIMGNFDINSVITERKLIEMFNVSKSPVREALVELCNENVLKSMPRYGYQIIQLDTRNIIDATEVRMLLELSGFEKTIKYLGNDELDALKKYNEECDKNRISADIWTHWSNNINFHLLLNSFSRNTLMYSMLERTLGILSRAFAQYYWNRWKNHSMSMSIDTHRNIVDLLENKDYSGAADKLKEDINFMTEQLLSDKML